MKLSPRDVEGFLKKPQGAALVYGPDYGLRKEREEALVEAFLGAKPDPMSVAEISADSLKDDPRALFDELSSLGFFASKKVVRVSEAGDFMTSMMKETVTAARDGIFLLVSAGDLGPSSSLRKLFEGAAAAASIACYRDEGEGLRAMITRTLAAEGFGADREALAYLAANLGEDRMITRSELEKLMAYMGAEKSIRLEHAEAALENGGSGDLSALALSVADGNAGMVENSLSRLFAEKISSIAILRAVSRHFVRLAEASSAMETGESAESAVAALRPPVFFKQAEKFKSQLRVWRVDAIKTALSLLLAAEMECKKNSSLQESLCRNGILGVVRRYKLQNS